MNEITAKRITGLETGPLRQKVLRPNWTLEQLVYDGDNDIDTYHAGVFLGDNLVGIASIYKKSRNAKDDNISWQLRGMAVSPDYQGKGIGKKALNSCIDYIKENSGKILWCNARLIAVDFYKSFGFVIKSDLFEIDDIGPHYIMEKVL